MKLFKDIWQYFEEFEWVTFFIVLIIGTMMSGMIMLLFGHFIFEFTDYLGMTEAYPGISPGGISMALGYSFVAACHVSINIDQVPKKDEDEDED